MDIPTLAATCQHQVHPQVIEATIDIESSGRPYALAAVGETTLTQPVSERGLKPNGTKTYAKQNLPDLSAV